MDRAALACPRCGSAQWLVQSEDPMYHPCTYCGPVFIGEPLPFVQTGMRRKEGSKDPELSSNCIDCGTPVRVRSKRCLECSRKVLSRGGVQVPDLQSASR